MAEECDGMQILSCKSGSPDLLSFVLPYEKLCIGLVSHILCGDSSFFLVQEHGVSRGAFSFSKGGQIFHCLPDAYGEKRGSLFRALLDFFRSRQQHDLFNVIGEEEGTNLVTQALVSATGRKIQHEQHYALLEQKTSAFGRDRHAFFPTMRDEYEKLAVLRCSPDMIDSLFPLQLAYEKEEVLWQNEPADERVIHLSFHRALRTQQIFALSKNGAFITKGGTNAWGKKYVQLGGIYTLPSERGRGYASELLRYISAEMKRQEKKMVLFAKTENAPALHLYEKCGFAKIGRFEIIYF